VSTVADLIEQNEALRARIERLERALPGQVDPILRALLEHAPAFLTVITPAGRFLATGRTSEVFGSVIGRSVFEFTPPDQHAMMRATYERVCALRQPVVYESIGCGENGEPNHTYVVRAVPVIEDDVVTAIVLVPTDITERVRLERSLVESEQTLRLAVKATRIGLWRWSVEENRVTWDQRLLEIFGVEATPADYDGYLALIHPDDQPMVRRVVEKALETGVYESFEHRLAPRADGLERWVLGMGAVLTNEAGKPVMVLGGTLDITDQKRVAAQLARAQRVEALGQLTAGLAHNFNNLLVAIIPNLELALHEAPQEQAALLTAAMDASLQARDLIKKLMSLTGPRPTGTSEPSDPREALERALAICRATFPREIQLKHLFDPDVGHVGMQSTDLEQVVLNLLVNARDAVEGTTGRARVVEVFLERVAEQGRSPRVRVRVRDNGAGMSRTVQARVFEPFFTTKPAYRGSGLGLADALMRVRAAEGTLECESTEGEGTTFVLLLPETPATAARSAATGTNPLLASRGETILIVDDEPAVRAVVTRLLKRHGYQVLEADGAEAARLVLAAHGAAIKLVLLDQSMPGQSGPEALPSLTQLSDAPIVMFTGGASSDLPPGAAAVLEKPASSDEILRTVRSLLDRTRAR
jgi:PAS domain S-box-containing protein